MDLVNPHSFTSCNKYNISIRSHPVTRSSRVINIAVALHCNYITQVMQSGERNDFGDFFISLNTTDFLMYLSMIVYL